MDFPAQCAYIHVQRFSIMKGDHDMLSHIILFRGFIFNRPKKTPAATAYPYSPPEWAAFNRALYQPRPRFSH
jgi:hypothetical protein